ncbi:GGDEF domain-containing protein [Paracoccus subflavus]|nr:diguanylate cyclase [Paracoccus subflavus]
MLADLIVVLNQFGLVSICSLLAGAVIRCGTGPEKLKMAAVGVVFGLGCCAAMLSPLRLEDGVFFDLRSLFIGLSTGLFGLVPGLLTLGFGIAFRLELGGAGVEPGVTSMLGTWVLCLVWRIAFGPTLRQGRGAVPALVMLGAAMSLSILAGLLHSPDLIIRALRNGFIGWLMLGDMVGAVFLGTLILGVLDTISREKTFSRLAMTDPLTGLLNRRGLDTAYEAWQQGAHSRAGALIVTIDIDAFKQFNDENGHPLGDKALIAVADAIRDSLRDGDLGARIGGDEFLMVVRDVAPDDSRLIRSRIHGTLAEVHVATRTGDRRPIRLSIGSSYILASAPLRDGSNLSDQQMYREKRRGRASLTAEERSADSTIAPGRETPEAPVLAE